MLVRTIGAQIIDADLPIGQPHEAFTNNERLVDSGLRSHLANIIEELLRQTPMGAGLCA